MIASCVFFHSGILHRQLRRRDLPAGQNAGQQSRQQRLLREEHQAGWIWPPGNRNSWTRYSWAQAALLLLSWACLRRNGRYPNVSGWGLGRAGKQQLVLIFLFIQPPSYIIYCAFFPVWAGRFMYSKCFSSPSEPDLCIRSDSTDASVFLLRHVCPHLSEEEGPGGETAGRGQHSGLHPHHSSNSCTWPDHSPFFLFPSHLAESMTSSLRCWSRRWWPWEPSAAGPPVTSTPLRMRWLLL